MVDEEGLQRLAEVVDEMKAVDDLHGAGRSPANAVGVQIAAIATDHGDRRVLGEPSGDHRRRALWSRSTTRCVTRSTRMVPYQWPLRYAHSSTARACRAGVRGPRAARTSRMRVADGWGAAGGRRAGRPR